MVPISPEIYSSTAVVMDNRGLSDYIARTQQRLATQKAAKDEALDKFFTDLKMKINPAGMRTQDTPGFNQKLQAWIADGIANKNEIAKGGLAKQNHLMKYQELLRDVDQSKQEAQLQADLDEKKKNDELEEEDLPTLENVSKSIYDPLHYKNLETKTPYSMADFSFSKPAWDVARRKQFIDFVSAGVQPAGKINEKTTIDPYTGNKVTTFDKVYTQDQLRDITQKAIAISSDSGGLKTYKRLLKQGAQQIPSEEFIALAKAYNSINPDDPMDTPLKVAMADIVLGKSGVMGSGRIAEGRPSKGTTFNFGGVGQTQQELSGNALDEVGSVKPVPISTKTKKGIVGKGTIENGVARDDRGNLYTGEVSFTYDFIPANLAAVLSYNKTPLAKYLPIIVQYKDGEAVGITQPGKPAINRKLVENAQLKYNTETQKGQQPEFGRTIQQPKSPIKTSPVLKGIPEGGF